jgi:uncharacterized protein YbaA (DUF1428 family)
MSKYVDGFVLPVPKRNIPAYRRMATQAGKIWRDHGALDYKECVGDDLHVKRECRFRAESEANRARPLSLPISLTNRAPIAIA